MQLQIVIFFLHSLRFIVFYDENIQRIHYEPADTFKENLGYYLFNSAYDAMVNPTRGPEA